MTDDQNELTGAPFVAGGPAGVPLTVTRPEGRPRAGVIVVQEAWGATDHLASVTAKLAAEGYLAVAPHLYHRSGDPVLDGTDFAAARPLMAALNGPDLRADLTDSVDYLVAQGVPQDRVGVVGFCMGGTVALWAAATLPLAAAVTFYGGGVLESRWDGVPPGVESARQLRAPWLGLFGDLDQSIPPDQVETLRSVLGQSGVAATIVRYPDAGHAFAGDPSSPRHVPDAAKDAWTRTLGWFDAHLR